MGNDKVKGTGKKVQFNIYVDPGILKRVNVLDKILNKHHKRHGSNISKSVYWEGVMKEHLNSRDVIELLAFTSGEIKSEGYLV